MFQRLFLILCIILAIVLPILWHFFASWFVRSEGTVPGLFLLAVILLLSRLIPE